MQGVGEELQKPRVCRRLFPAEEPSDNAGMDNIFNQIHEEISRDLDAACQKYNFDFRTEKPLEGTWEWEKIEPPSKSEAPGDPAPSAPPVEIQEQPQDPPVHEEPPQ